MYLLDTNIISLFDPSRREREHAVIEKLRRIEGQSYFSVLTLTEIEAGILKLRREDKDKRADQLADFRDGLLRGWADRILPVTPDIALDIARISERARPNVVERVDLIIAATAAFQGFTVITRNVRHFLPTGVPWLDPSDLP